MASVHSRIVPTESRAEMYRWRQNDCNESRARVRLEKERVRGSFAAFAFVVCMSVCVCKVDGLYICSVISPSQSNHFHLGPAQREAPDWR